MPLHVPFDNSYARLPDRFYTRLAPTPVKSPGLIRINTGLAKALGIDPQALAVPEGLAMLAGNHIPEGAEPLAQTYAGHQFGGWNPQLGDGRAILLGEVTDQTGQRRDIQLKGSGPTPYSRMGDGRAWVGPVLREYIVSEAMHALGIPTTRALAAVTTGEIVLREGAFPGAVFARVAASHIRVGTFQFFFARQDTEALGLLLAHIAERHYPDTAPEPLAVLDAVVARQAELIAKWMGVGFIHGVMNTDNMTLSGETIDYGPCAFLDTYHPETVFSSIDQFGRYAYQNQPQIAHWNLAQFATTLLPLMGNDDAAVAAATDAINRFPDLYKVAWEKVFRAKIGLTTVQDGDTGLVTGLLDAMTAGRADFTNTFRGLATGTTRLAFEAPEPYDDWAPAWHKRLAKEPGGLDAARTRLMQVNPAIIPRNHQVEAAIAAALNGDYAVFHALTEALQTPFTDAPAYAAPPQADEVVQQTFCGT